MISINLNYIFFEPFRLDYPIVSNAADIEWRIVDMVQFFFFLRMVQNSYKSACIGDLWVENKMIVIIFVICNKCRSYPIVHTKNPQILFMTIEERTVGSVIGLGVKMVLWFSFLIHFVVIPSEINKNYQCKYYEEKNGRIMVRRISYIFVNFIFIFVKQIHFLMVVDLSVS